MIQTVQGLVLRAEDLAEYDQRLTLYTRELGKIRAKVVGVKKTVSKLRALTTPFVESRFQVYLHGTKRAGVRDPGKIVGGEIVTVHGSLRTDWDRMIQSMGVLETLDVLTHPFYANPQEYELLSQALTRMETTTNPLLLRLHFTLSLLKILGYSLRAHPVWHSYSPEDRRRLLDLAVWDAVEERFSARDVEVLERIVNSYLSNYLSGPLKTEVFRQKLEMAAAEVAL
jgi:DNA repair protein RecO